MANLSNKKSVENSLPRRWRNLSARPFSLLLLIFGILFASGGWISAAPTGGDYQSLISQIQQTLASTSKSIQDRVKKEGTNAPTPEFEALVKKLQDKLLNDPSIQEKIKTDRALAALYNQTLNHLKHVSFDFEIEGKGYPHDLVLKGPYPFRPTQTAMEKTEEFFKIASATSTLSAAPEIPKNLALEKQLMDDQKELVKKVTNESFATYENMRSKLKGRADKFRHLRGNEFSTLFLLDKLAIPEIYRCKCQKSFQKTVSTTEPCNSSRTESKPSICSTTAKPTFTAVKSTTCD